MRKHISLVIMVSIIILDFNTPARGCSAFYGSDGDVIFIGNNEDVPESLAQAWSGTHMWFIPPEDGHYGQVCFGYGETNPYGVDFAQGGMNEAGLVFDYFSTPYYEITESLDKPIYYRALADSAMEVYSAVEDVIELYDQFNLQAQYLEYAQVMFGDTLGNSAIIEGDSTLVKERWYQICTNFYQSCPEAGGYPCWRYDDMVEMLDTCNEFNVEFCRTVLASVGSEEYTQYSHIYDPKAGSFLLFYHGNFEEYIDINLQEELAKGSNSYELSSLFADLRLVSPENDTEVSPASVIFQWTGKSDCNYRLYYSESRDFQGCVPVAVSRTMVYRADIAPLSILLVLLMPLGLVYRYTRKAVPLVVLFIIVSVAIIACDAKGVLDSGVEDGTFSVTLPALKSNTTYYWKITAQATDAFMSESIVRTFTTSS